MANYDARSNQPTLSESDKAKKEELLSGWNALSNRNARLDLLEAQLSDLGEEIGHASALSSDERVRLGVLSSMVRALTGE